MIVTQYNHINEIHGEDQVNLSKEEIYRLWQECFGDSKEYTDFYFTWKIKDNRVLTLYKEDTLCSMLHLNPYLLAVKGQLIPANYIVGVATKKEERKQGFMRILLEKALKDMYQEQMPFTYLMPAAEAIYSPYDFRVVYEQKPWNHIMRRTVEKWKDPAAQRNQNVKGTKETITIRPLSLKDTEDIERLVSFANSQLYSQYDIYVHRTPYYYERLIHEMESGYGKVLVAYKENQIIGSLSYMAEEDIYITEMISSEVEEENLLEALALYFTEHLCKDIHQSKEHKTTTIMARIVDFSAFMKQITSTEEVSIKMKVVDPIIEGNNGTYQLDFTKEGCHVRKTVEEPDLTLGIAEVTNLFFGRWSKVKIDQSTRYPMGDKDIIEELDKINKYSRVFINDVV